MKDEQKDLLRRLRVSDSGRTLRNNDVVEAIEAALKEVEEKSRYRGVIIELLEYADNLQPNDRDVVVALCKKVLGARFPRRTPNEPNEVA
jgi:hypothetical protein